MSKKRICCMLATICLLLSNAGCVVRERESAAISTTASDTNGEHERTDEVGEAVEDAKDATTESSPDGAGAHESEAPEKHEQMEDAAWSLDGSVGASPTTFAVGVGIYETESPIVIIQYPQISGLPDAEDEARLNELIRTEAIYIINRFDPDVWDRLGMRIEFEVKLLNADILSIVYYGLGSIMGFARAHMLFYTTNIDMQRIEKFRLADYLCVDQRLLDMLRNQEFTWVKKMMDYDYTTFLDIVLYTFTDESIIEMLERSDSIEDSLNSVYTYLTDEVMGISFYMPQAFGGHTEYEIPLAKISDLVLPDSILNIIGADGLAFRVYSDIGKVD